MESRQVVVDVFGDYALFTRPEHNVERTSYEVITPSAARGILCSIYMKPSEFFYEITKIEIMKPIKYTNIKRNEVKEKINKKLEPIYVDKTTENGKRDDMHGRTQRNSYMLKNVYYRIYANIVRRVDCPADKTMGAIYQQFVRRVKKGKCFHQPYLGTKECICYFKVPDFNLKPLETLTLKVGNMLYDVFDITNNIPLDTSKQRIKKAASNESYSDPDNILNVSFFDAEVVNGVLIVPPFFSRKIRRVRDV